jgi:hypothetical protein
MTTRLNDLKRLNSEVVEELVEDYKNGSPSLRTLIWMIVCELGDYLENEEEWEKLQQVEDLLQLFRSLSD